MDNSAPTPVHPQLALLEPKIKALEDALLSSDPKMPLHLKEIHKTLQQYEELAHLLTESQIAVVMEGMQRQSGIILAAETKKKSGSQGKLKGIDADDL